MACIARIFFCTAAVIAGSNSLAAGDCVALANALRTTESTVTNDSQFQNYAQQFCSEYSQNRGQASSGSANIGYKALSFGLSASEATQESVYKKNCSGLNYTGDRKSAFQQYLSKFDPQAYSVVQSCEMWEKNGIELDMPNGSVLPTNLFATLRLDSRMGAKAELSIMKTDDLTCTNNRQGTFTRNSVTFAGSVTVQCTRTNYEVQSSLHLSIKNNGQVKPFVIYWDGFTKEGLPQRQMQKLINQIDLATKNTVVGFSLTACPTGWMEYEPARGRFLRGIDTKGGNSVDPDGLRAPGNMQGDLVGPHSHPYMDIFHSENVSHWPGGSFELIPNGVGSGSVDHDNVGYQKNRETSNNNGNETRPKNTAVLFCTRAN